MKLKVDQEDFTNAVAQDLLWHYETSGIDEKLKKALLRVAMFYMTYDQGVQYLGSEVAAEEYWS